MRTVRHRVSRPSVTTWAVSDRRELVGGDWLTVAVHDGVVVTYPGDFNGLDRAPVAADIAHWGAWLGLLNRMGGVVGVSIIFGGDDAAQGAETEGTQS